jgi:hypothetical protein
MRFAFDEGLPGKAWAQRHPIVLKDFKGSYFKRIDAAEEAGLTCGIALPVFGGNDIKAVIVFFCGHDADHVGVIEVWRHDPDKTPGIRFADGYFGEAEMFEWNARNITFMPGNGLPGTVWLRNRPVFIPDLGNKSRFLRADQARKVGLTKGLGIPCQGDKKSFWAMLFLSALGAPIAQRQEIWSVDKQQEKIVFETGDCSRDPEMTEKLKGMVLGRDDGLMGYAFSHGVPKITTDLGSDENPASKIALAAGLSSMLALPIYDEHSVRSVVAFYF